MAGNLSRRIEKLERTLGTREEATLELLLQAADGDPLAKKRLAQCDPDSPLIRLLAQTRGPARSGNQDLRLAESSRRTTTGASRPPPMMRWTPPGWQYGIDVPS